MYILGIEHQARPFERLQRKYKEFLERLKHAEPLEKVPLYKPVLKNADAKGLKTSKSNRNVQSSKIQVFKDNGEEDLAETVLPSRVSSLSVDLGPNQRKENEPVTEAWVGTTLPQYSSQPISEKLDVFRDEEEPVQVKKSTKTSLLQSKPLDPSLLQSMELPKEQPGQKLQVDMRLCYIKGQDYCFEETRAASIGFKFEALPSRLTRSLKTLDSDSSFSSVGSVGHLPTSSTSNSGLASSRKNSAAETQPSVQLGISISSKSSPMMKKTAHRPPSPTINTKAAMADVLDMFSQSHISHFSDDEEPNDPNAVYYCPEDDETISRQVYRPVTTKMSVFRDEASCSKFPVGGNFKMPVFRDEEPMVLGNEVGKMPVFRDEEPVVLGNEVGKMPVFRDEQQEKEPASRDEVGKMPVFRDEQQEKEPACRNEKVQVLRDQEQQRPMASTPMMPEKPAGKHVLVCGRPVDIMTPVTEISDQSSRLFTNISTISKYPSIIHEGEETIFEDTLGKFSHPSETLTQHMHQLADDDFNAQEFDLEVDADEIELAPLEVSNPCDPTEPSIRFIIMKRHQPPKDSKVFLHLDQRSSWQIKLAKLGSIELPEMGKYQVLKLLGQGGCGSVYSLRGWLDEDMEEYALKIQSPPSAWEYYIMYMLHQRLEPSFAQCIPRPLSCHVYQNVSLLLLDHVRNGSLLDAVNRAHKHQFGAMGGGVDELLALFWTLKLLELVDALHKANVLHGDIKIGY